MSVPVTNAAYSQQNNQLFDWAKTATPQQIEAAKQGLPKDSPLLLAIGMGVQYQQQARAPHPQAPQKTIMEQKLGEFTQASSQGLPQINQNQMAMQQVAQQNPMFGAGLAVAPENTEQAPAPQQMAATGGITALAHGGEVRHFEEGGDAALDPLSNVDASAQPEDPGMFDPGIFSTYYHKGLTGGLAQAGSTIKKAAKKGYEKASDIGKDLLYGADRPDEPLPMDPTAPTFPVPEIKDKAKDTAPKGIASLKTKNVDPNQFDQAAANMDMGEEPVKTKIEPVGKHDVIHTAAEGSSAARNEAAPTAYEEKEAIKKFRGPEADMSEEVGMAKEYAANASRDKGLGALVGGIGGMLSAQTPNMGQAVGAGLMSGLSSYQSGAKDEQAANKDLMALQMAQKKALMTGDREAADLYLAQKNAEKTAAAAAAAKWAELKYGKDSAKEIAQMGNKSAEKIADMKADNDWMIERFKAKVSGSPNGAQLLSAYQKAVDTVTNSVQGMNLPREEIETLAQEYVRTGVLNPMGGGNSGVGGQPLGQPLGSGSVRYSAPAAQ
jgi:hypothetical protein